VRVLYAENIYLGGQLGTDKERFDFGFAAGRIDRLFDCAVWMDCT